MAYVEMSNDAAVTAHRVVTSVFIALVEDIRLRGTVKARPPVRVAPRSPLEHAFADLAARTRTAEARVARLVRLAQRKGLFDDPAAEINELTGACGSPTAKSVLSKTVSQERSHVL